MSRAGSTRATRARVERYVREHPEAQAHLALAREESDATITANEAIQAPGRDALDRLRASVAAAPRRQPLGAAFGQLANRFSDWIAGLGAAAACAGGGGGGAAGHAASRGDRRAGDGARRRADLSDRRRRADHGESFELLVGFADTATMGDIAALLKRLDAVVIDGPRAGLYRLRLPDTGEEGRKAAIEALQSVGDGHDRAAGTVRP